MKTHSCFTVLKLHMLHLKLMLNKKKTRKETVSGQGPRPFLLLNTPASVLHERGGGDKRQEKKESRSEQARRAQQL